jgi:outer membrane protein OmpA-like peptidoglycan-associated protein
MTRSFAVALLGSICLAAFSGCAVSNVDDRARPQSTVESGPKLNTFQVFFDPDGSNISETAAQTLRNAADGMKQGYVTGITLSVHSTVAGWDAYSQALSERRAEAVKAELVKDGVPADEISRVDIGRSQVVSTTDGVREPQNRRTEIILR